MKHIKLSKAARLAGKKEFQRCGVPHTEAGATFAEDQFTPEEWDQIENDRMLEVTLVDAPVPTPQDVQADLATQVLQAIGNLSAGEFDASGKPNLGALRDALPDDAKAITAKLRDEVWASMKDMAANAPELDTEEDEVPGDTDAGI